MTFIDKTVESYKDFLRVKYPSHYTLFCRRLSNQPESARAEAIIFSLFRSACEDVEIAEDIVTGGADFLCVTEETEFMVEVTCLEGEAVATQSGWPNEAPEGVTSGSFGMITHMLRTKASEKTSQLSGYNMSRMLVITTEHVAADVLLGPYGAETFLTSDTRITVPIGEPIKGKVHLTTDLKDSVFFRIKNGVLESCRRSISAILLSSILGDKSLVVGILHPDPRCQFPIELLPSVPFLRMRKWPPENNRIETEWMIHKPKPAEFYHYAVVFKDKN